MASMFITLDYFKIYQGMGSSKVPNYVKLRIIWDYGLSNIFWEKTYVGECNSSNTTTTNLLVEI